MIYLISGLTNSGRTLVSSAPLKSLLSILSPVTKAVRASVLSPSSYVLNPHRIMLEPDDSHYQRHITKESNIQIRQPGKIPMAR